MGAAAFGWGLVATAVISPLVRGTSVEASVHAVVQSSTAEGETDIDVEPEEGEAAVADGVPATKMGGSKHLATEQVCWARMLTT